MKSIVLLAALVAWTAPVLSAHEGHLHHYMGTITAASASQLSLKTTDGKTVTFKLDETTRIVKGKAPAGVRDLEPGIRAVVDAEGGKEPTLAKTVKLASSAEKD
jgi:hypothetical protein